MSDVPHDNPVAKLRLSEDVALAGAHPRYWNYKSLCSVLGISELPIIRLALGSMLEHSEASSMASASIVDRAYSTVPSGTVMVIRPSWDPSTDSGG